MPTRANRNGILELKIFLAWNHFLTCLKESRECVQLCIYALPLQTLRPVYVWG